MSAIGGSIESVTLNGTNFPVTADADTQRKLGGFENEIQPNGNGSARIIKSRVPWSISGLVLEVDDGRGDQEFIQSLANKNEFFPIAITYASGVTYQGRGQIVDETQASSQSVSATVSLMGPGELTPQ